MLIIKIKSLCSRDNKFEGEIKDGKILWLCHGKCI